MRAAGQMPIAIALCAIASCAAISAADDVPAVIVRPDAQSRAELQNAVSKALNRTSVFLAGDALTHDSRLTIEPVRLRDSAGGIAQGRAQGRETRMPESFRLVKNGQHCVLVRERTGQRMELSDTHCAAQQ